MKENTRKKPLKAVLDTNILVSGLFSESGTIFELMNLWADEQFELAISLEILEELYRVLHKPTIRKHFKPTEKEITDFIEIIKENAFITPGMLEISVIKDDPTDNKFLVCAKEAAADFIVSGDKHLKGIKQFENIKIVDAKTFIDKVRKID